MAEKIEQLEQRIADLEKRFAALEKKPVAISKQPEPQSIEELMEAELEALEEDKESRVKDKMAKGLKRDKAVLAVEQRIEFLRSELGIKVKGAAAKAVALIIALLTLAFAFAPAARADQQGFPQTFTTLTLPPVINAQSYSNLLSFGITNIVPIHRGTGLGMEWLNYSGAGTVNTNNALFFSPSMDGTNIDSWQTIGVYSRPNGGTVVCSSTNWAAIYGVKCWFLIGISNLNLGPLTNQQATAHTPNGGP